MNYERLKYLRPLWLPLLTLITKKKDNYNKENENIIKRVGEKKKIKNSNQYTMGIYGVFCWFYAAGAASHIVRYLRGARFVDRRGARRAPVGESREREGERER